MCSQSQVARHVIQGKEISKTNLEVTNLLIVFHILQPLHDISEVWESIWDFSSLFPILIIGYTFKWHISSRRLNFLRPPHEIYEVYVSFKA